MDYAHVFDTRLIKERPTKSEDDLRKMNLESTLDGTKNFAKDFNRTDQRTIYRPIVNCMLIN